MFRILFVCSGNICRSPMAEGLLKKFLKNRNLDNQISVCSAGTLDFSDSPASENSILACQSEYQTDISEHKAQVVSEELLQNADLVICMGQKHLDTINWEFSDYFNKCKLLKTYAGICDHYLDIADPIGGSLEEYIETCHEISGLLEKSMENILVNLVS